jgi:hypothetical protein
VDDALLNKCRKKLIETAAARTNITYSEMAAHLGIANQGPWREFLNAIYREEMSSQRPDLTLVLVYANTRYGRYCSLGNPEQSKRVDPNNEADVRAYDAERERVYKHWEPK